MVGDNVFHDCLFRDGPRVPSGQAVFRIGLDGRHMDGFSLIIEILPGCIDPAVCASHRLESYSICAGVIGGSDKAERDLHLAVSGGGGDKFEAGIHLIA